MNCTDCHLGTLESRRGARPYSEVGLEGVELADIEIRNCRSCGAETVVLPRITLLHREIARAIVTQRRFLHGKEVQYLRKMLDWSPDQFSATIGVHPTELVVWEGHGLHLTTLIPADRLLRFVAACELELEVTPNDLCSLLREVEAQPKYATKIQASFLGGGWFVTTERLEAPAES